MNYKFYFGEIILIEKTLQFAKICGYSKGKYKVKLFSKRSNRRNLLIDSKENAKMWQEVKKINLKSNILFLRNDFLIKIAPDFDFWVIYNLRFLIKKLLRQPLPYYNKFMFMQFKQSVKYQRVNKKKHEIKLLFEKQKDLIQTIGEWDGKGSEYNYICSKLSYKYDRNQVLKIHKSMDFLKKYI